MLKSKGIKRMNELREVLEFCSLKFYKDEFRLLDDEIGHIMTFYTEKQFMDWTSKYIELSKEMKKHLLIDFYEQENRKTEQI